MNLHTYSTLTYSYRIVGKIMPNNSGVKGIPWEIEVYIWDEYDFDYGGNPLNYYGALLEDIGVVDPYEWQLNFYYYYIEMSGGF